MMIYLIKIQNNINNTSVYLNKNNDTKQLQENDS